MNNISLAAVLIVALAIPCCAIAQTQAPAPKQAGAPPATSAPAPKQAGAPPVTSAPAPKQSGAAAAAAAAAPKAPAPVTAVAPPTEAAKPVIRASHRVPSNADARACLEFPTNLQIIKCAEKYRWAS